jgi:aspartate carbamoyltransferase catalytic subunit
VDGLTVTMMGDLKYGRTVHSLARLLTLYDIKLNYVAPDILRMPPEIVDEIAGRGIPQTATADLMQVLPDTDVLYVTRVQKERFEDPTQHETLKGSYSITAETMTHAKDEMIVMHPLPRVWEIDMAVDEDPGRPTSARWNTGSISGWRCWRWCWVKPEVGLERVFTNILF